MELNIEAQKQEFLTICRASIQREGLEDLLAWMSKADFFTAPASTKYHGGYAGGLCQHSIDVYQYAKKLLFLMPKAPSEESVAIATLFHDLCKVNFYKTKISGRNNSTFTVDEQLPFGGHGSKSVYVLSKYLKDLTDDEAIAINCHMGFSRAGDSTISIGESFRYSPLAWIIHVADEAATFMLDRGFPET